MVLKLPPPPRLTREDLQAVNRWLLELQAILNNSGDIDQSSVDGLTAVTTQVGVNTGNIATNSASITTINSEITTINGEITTINGEITTINSEIAAIPIVRNGAGAPANMLGNINDWYADTTNKHIYVKTAAAVWTLIV
jgi:hypothetical protein